MAKREKKASVGRQDGGPSKHQRRVKGKLDRRIASYESADTQAKKGMHKPGSQNLHHQ